MNLRKRKEDSIAMRDQVIKTQVKSKESLPQIRNRRLTSKARKNWETFFRAMAKRNDDELLDDSLFVLTIWEKNQWQW